MKNSLNFSSSRSKSGGQFTAILDAISNPVILLFGETIVHINNAAVQFCNLESGYPSSITDLFDIEDEQNLISLNKLSRSMESDAGSTNQEVIFRLSPGSGQLVKGVLKPLNLNGQNFALLELDKESNSNVNASLLSNEIANDIFSELSLPMCIVNRELELQKYNKSFMDLLCIDEKTSFDKFFLLKMIPNSAKREFVKAFEYSRNSDQKKKCEFDVKLRSGNSGDRFLSFEVHQLSDNLKWIVVIKDHSREIKLFRDLDKANAQAKKLKSIFVAQISHEIRTPINAILSFANLIKEELSENLPPDIQSGFEVINRGGERIIRTINLILDTSEVMTDSYEFFPTELDLFSDVFNEVFLKYKKIAEEKNIECMFTRETNDLMISGDEYMTKQIFSNIFDNAVKFTSEGSIHAHLYKNKDDNLTVEITDSGIGMSQKYIDQVYEPFTQEDEGLRRRYEGNGLGLTLTKSYCDINNIDIEIKSDKSTGTTVKLVFKNSIENLSIEDEESKRRPVIVNIGVG